MKKHFIITMLLGIHYVGNTQTINNLDFDRKEAMELDNYYPFLESISESNRLNDNTQTNNYLYTTLNYHKGSISASGHQAIQGVINWRNNTANYIQFEAVHNSNPISTVNCTQDGDNALVAGGEYSTNIITPGFPNGAEGILMIGQNPTLGFMHDLVKFNFASLSPSITPVMGIHNPFIFMIDAVRDNAGNIYAVGMMNKNYLTNYGLFFMIKLDPNYNIIDMWHSGYDYEGTWERVVYDDQLENIYMIGKCKNVGPFQPIIAKYEINTGQFTHKIFDQDETFFDIKKDPATNQLVVGWVEYHYYEIGLLFFDDNLNLLSYRTWDNQTNLIFNTNNDPVNNPDADVNSYNLKPNSIYIGNTEIFIRGSGSRSYLNLNPLPLWYANHYVSTDRFFYGNLNGALSHGRYLENSTNILFQTMGLAHPWSCKRWVNYNNELASITDRARVVSQTAYTGNYKNHGLDFLLNYNINPSLNKVSNISTVDCQNLQELTTFYPISKTFNESTAQFYQYTPLPTDYDIFLDQTLIPYNPIQDMCYGPANPNYKLAGHYIETDKILRYRVYNMVGQIIAKNEGDKSANIDNFITKIRKTEKLENKLYLIEIETEKETIRRKIQYTSF